MLNLAPRAPQIAPETSRLRVLLLGPPDLRVQGAPLPLVRRQARAIVYRLAASPEPVPRDELCFLLWPDAPQASARRNLTVLLNQLRRALPQPALLHTYDDAIALDPARIWTDAPAFGSWERQARRERHSAMLDHAVALYRGPFMAGFSLPDSPDFEEWLAAERRSWERRYLAALGLQVAVRTAARDWAGAIVAAERSLAVDELAEDGHAALITLLAHSGDRAAALRQYRRCVAVLDHELGVAPLPATAALFEALRRGDLPPLPATPPEAQGWDTGTALASPSQLLR